jgi:nitrogenase molybdenum-iron protein alpha/beta subunit
MLTHSGLIYAGDPHLLGAVGGFARELGLRVQAAFLNCRSRQLSPGAAAPVTLFSPAVEAARAAARALDGYDKPALAVCDSFALAEGFAAGAAWVEFGFPSYTRHCLHDEPFLGYAGAAAFGGRLLNAALRHGDRSAEVRA